MLAQKNRSSRDSIFNEDISLGFQALNQKTPNTDQKDTTENLLDQNMKFLDLKLCKLNKEIITSPKLMMPNNLIAEQHTQTINNRDNLIIPRIQKFKVPEILSIGKTLKGQRENYNFKALPEKQCNTQEIRRSNEFQQNSKWSFGNEKELFVKSARIESNYKPLSTSDLNSARKF